MPHFLAIKNWLIGWVVVMAFLTSLPSILPQNFLNSLPQWIGRLHIPLAIDLRGGSRLVVQMDNVQNPSAIDAVITIMRQRLNKAGGAFANHHITHQGKGQIRIEVPALFDVDLLKSLVTTTAKLTLYQPYQGVSADDVIIGRVTLPAGAQIFYDSADDPPIGHLVQIPPLLTSEEIDRVKLEPFPKSENRFLDKKREGAEKLESFVEPSETKTALTKNQPDFLDLIIKPHHQTGDVFSQINSSFIAVLDGEVIANASLNKDGDFILERLPSDFAENLEVVLNAGALPVSTHVIEERTIGADLGDEFAQAGKQAVIGALFIVALFMIIFYGLPGLIANLALAANLALLTSILSLGGLTLSLAGFAGLVLTLGVSVDGLILIYERIKEERRKGVALSIALDTGFLRARSTIIDANVTTLLGAMMLFLFGSGPISGFAMTVTIGICTSLFTSLLFARWLFMLWFHYCRPQNAGRWMLRILPTQTTISFMRLRKFCLGLAAGSVCLTMILYASVGIHYGIDFTGGSLAVLSPHAGDVNIIDIANRADKLNIGTVSVQKSQNKKNAYLTIPSQIMGESADQTVALKLRGEFDTDYQLERVDVVGPSLSVQHSLVSIWAVFLSLLAIFLYVWVRFNWKFGLGALISTLHDVVILLLIFILTGWEFNLWSIAALLAIIGYSLNDTIVVYDRIRFLLTGERIVNMTTLIDQAINCTLSRTILTSLATLLAHIPLYYYGETDMRNFASVLLIGIFVGTASSIFIAGPLLVILKMKQLKYG